MGQISTEISQPAGSVLSGNQHTGESDAAVIALADRSVAHVQDQPKTPSYRDEYGNERRTTLDFLITKVDGTRIGLAVKPESKRQSSGIDAVVGALARDNPNFADRILVRTEHNIPRNAAFNARLILRSRKLRIEKHCDDLANMAADVAGAIRIKDLLKLYRTDGAGFTAAVNLIDDGRLIPRTKDRITHRLMVRSLDSCLNGSTAPLPQPRIFDLNVFELRVLSNPISNQALRFAKLSDIDAFDARYVTLFQLTREFDIHFSKLLKHIAALGIELAFPNDAVKNSFYFRSDIDKVRDKLR